MFPREHFHYVVTSSQHGSSSSKVAILVALLASLATFIFLLLAEFIRSIKERRTTHLNSLVTLQVELVLDSEAINENLRIIPDFIESLRQHRPFLHVLGTFDVNLSHFQELHNLEVSNNLLTYQIHIRKLNKDISATQKNYDELKSGLISGDAKRQKLFIDNAPQFITWLEQLSEGLKTQLKEQTRLEAEIRMHIKKDPSWLRKQKMKFLRNPGVTDREIQAEIEKILRERDDSEKEDTDRAAHREAS